MDSHGPMDDRDTRMEDMERRLDQLETRRTASERSRAAMKVIVPEETRRHLRAAGREQLLAVRSLLDHWISRMRDEDDESSDNTRERIPVD
jgi:hypothetical protein